jgi:hypothetical protein
MSSEITSLPATQPPGSSDTMLSAAANNTPDFGPNVIILDPSMSQNDIQSKVDSAFQTQESNQFGKERRAILFKPGSYQAHVQVGFYTTVAGLGTSPDNVTITGGVNVTATWFQGNATQNFWRGIENLAVIPQDFGGRAMWATSQATWQRRVHIRGPLSLFDFWTKGPNNWSSGGFIADSTMDSVDSGSQQQYLTRNCQLGSWQGGGWNMVFVGDYNAPGGTWPNEKRSVVGSTPVIREKPYLIIDGAGDYSVVVPGLKRNSQGPSWTSSSVSGTNIPIDNFYICHYGKDNASTMNTALQNGMHLLLTPGVYDLSEPVLVRNASTVVLGMGLATLRPTNGNSAIIVSDVDGVTIAGILFDAGPNNSPNLLQIGDVNGSNADHSANPTALFDVFARVGGVATNVSVTSCLVVNSRHVLMDNIWLWRADHGIVDVGWWTNPAENGLVVNSNDVTAYGLFVEHFKGFQTLWNGNGGSVYFYQCEIPYDVPNQDVWRQNGENGYPGYKVSNNVTTHTALGLGLYCFFWNKVQLENAIETPPNAPQVSMHRLIIVWLGQAEGSSINHIINGGGNAVFNHYPNMVSASWD